MTTILLIIGFLAHSRRIIFLMLTREILRAIFVLVGVLLAFGLPISLQMPPSAHASHCIIHFCRKSILYLAIADDILSICIAPGPLLSWAAAELSRWPARYARS